MSHSRAYAAARAASRLATAVISTLSESRAGAITSRLMCAVERIPTRTLVHDLPQRRIERAEPLIPLGVSRRPRGVGLNLVPDADARLDRLPHIAEDPSRDAAEQRSTVRRALLGDSSLERQAEHRGDNTQPELAARPSTGHPPGRDFATEFTNDLETIT